MPLIQQDKSKPIFFYPSVKTDFTIAIYDFLGYNEGHTM